MVEETYQRGPEGNYLIIKEAEEKISFETYMITENKIPGLLKSQFDCMDGEQILYYDITSRQNLEVALERKKLTYKELLDFLEELKKVFLNLEDYLLEGKKLLLKPNYIYVDLSSGKPTFCYFPYYEGNIKDDFFDLAEYFLGRVDRQDKDAVEFAYELYHKAGEENYSLEAILEGKEKKIVEKTMIQEETEGTCILKREEKESFILYSNSLEYEDMVVSKETFLIGKKKNSVDGFLKDRGISRVHAKIVREDMQFYLTDLNSMNGTFVNERKLEVNETVELKSGDQLRFARIGFEVG